MNFGSALEQVHCRAPLVDCITNFVTVNDCANILLAVGGSPTMASDIREVQETAAAASALLCNLGAIDKVESMILGGQAANRAGKPVVFDPVGAGNTSLRRAESARLLDAVQFAVIRGNASEIRALAQRRAAGRISTAADIWHSMLMHPPRFVRDAALLSQGRTAVRPSSWCWPSTAATGPEGRSHCRSPGFPRRKWRGSFHEGLFCAPHLRCRGGGTNRRRKPDLVLLSFAAWVGGRKMVQPRSERQPRGPGQNWKFCQNSK